MCDIKHGFKLCTCHDVDENKSHWKLHRFKDGPDFVLGLPNLEFYDEVDIDFIEGELNARNCFDFEYTPQVNDRLIIYVIKDKELIDICFDYMDDECHKGWGFVHLFAESDEEILERGKIEYER